MQVENLGLLVTPFGLALRALALTCDDLRSLWSRSNLHEIQSKFFTVWSPNPSQRKLSDVRTSISLLLVNKRKEMSALKWVFLRLACTCEENYLSVWPPNASFFASSACCYLQP